MANQLVEAMKIGEEKARQEMQVAGAYDEYVPDRWEKEYTDDTYKKLGIPINKQGNEEIEQLNIPGLLDLVQQLQIGPRDVEMAMEMWPNLRGIGVNVPSADDTGASDDYYGTPSNNPDMPDGWQLSGSPSFDINESSKTRKIRGIRKLQEGGKGGEAGAAGEMLKKLGGPQLPINLAHNYRPGPTDGKLYNLLMIRANELRNQGKNQEAIDLMKIATPLHKLEQV